MYRSLVLVSALVVALSGATRPRYGGTLRVQPGGAPPDLTNPASERDHELQACIAETLVRFGESGDIERMLATGWESDASGRTWRFTLRPGVRFHNGAALTPSIIASALMPHLPGAEITATSDSIRIHLQQPDPMLVRSLADVPIVAESTVGTGPFRLDGQKLVAFEQHWAGRPFLDAVELSTTQPDVWEVSPGIPRRGVPEKLQISSSQPLELIAIENTGEAAMSAAISLAIDRAPMAAVLTQRRGEATAGLLPQFLTGYAFTFDLTRDIARSRQLLPNPPLLILSYDSRDPLARAVAERVAVNTRDAGINIQPKPDTNSTLRVKRIRLQPDAITSLEALGAIDVTKNPQTWYSAERALLDSGKIIPLMHVPVMWGAASYVRMPPTTRRCPFDSVWLAK